jgi:hypothetical protein
MMVQSMIQVKRIIAVALFCSACFALPTTVKASILAAGSDLGQSSMARSKPAAPSILQILADIPVDPNVSTHMPDSLTQGNNASGVGHSSTSNSGPSANSAAVESPALRSSPQLAFRLSEAALVFPSPHLERVLRPPRS